MNHSIEKLENPARVREMQVKSVLDRLGVSDGETVCDVGAGTGLFALAAAKRTRAAVWALEVSEPMLELLRERGEQQGLDNLHVRRVTGPLPLADGCCGVCLLVTVYHELEAPQAMLEEIFRVLRPGGRLGVIEFHARETPMGPPLSCRVSARTLRVRAEAAGLSQLEHVTLGENLYLSVFQRPT